MKLEITTSKIKEINLLTRLTLFILGIFFTSVIFSLNIKLFASLGIWIAMIISIALIITAFKTSTHAKTYRRIIAWGIIATIICGTLFMTVGVYLATSRFAI